jgi:hypothetical protein
LEDYNRYRIASLEENQNIFATITLMQPDQPIDPNTTPNEPPVIDSSAQQPESSDGWVSAGNGEGPQAELGHDIPLVTWSASEFIEHEKQFGWFVGLALIAVVGCAIIFLITRDVFTTGALFVAAALFGVAAKRKPQVLQYSLSPTGIKIGNKVYQYERFKSFSVIAEGALNSIHLSPLGRIAPPLSLYFPPEQEEEIVSALANYLPHEDRTHDPVDRLMRRIRF